MKNLCHITTDRRNAFKAAAFVFTLYIYFYFIFCFCYTAAPKLSLVDWRYTIQIHFRL